MSNENYYRIGKSIWKGIKALLSIYGVSVVADLPEGVDAFIQDWPVIIGSILLALTSAGWNAYKNRGKEGNWNPFDNIGKTNTLLLLCFVALSLSACAYQRPLFHEIITTTDAATGNVTVTETKISGTTLAAGGSAIEESQTGVSYSAPNEWVLEFKGGNTHMKTESIPIKDLASLASLGSAFQQSQTQESSADPPEWASAILEFLRNSQE